MDDSVITIVLNEGVERTFEIWRDQEPPDPRENDNLGTICCAHKRYLLGDEQIASDQYSSLGEFAIRKFGADGIFMPVYLMDHSGLSISTTDFGCQWDSGVVGVIGVSKEKILKEYGEDRPSDEQIKEYLKGEIKEYDKYIQGEGYGFTLREKNPDCSHCNREGEWDEVHSGGGFLGDDFLNNGILDELSKEEYEIVKECLKKENL